MNEKNKMSKEKDKMIFGETIQLYTTGKCNMGCPHCSSRLQDIPDMKLETFTLTLGKLEELGIKRVELFANDPSLHPDFDKQIELLNYSGLEYAILCIGDNIINTGFHERFKKSILNIGKNGGLVFSVDYTEGLSERILKDNHPDLFSYGFKANTFWKLMPFLKDNNISVRTNTVITNDNINEVIPILERVASNNIAGSFCFIQKEEKEFKELIETDTFSILRWRLEKFRRFLEENTSLKVKGINDIFIHSLRIIDSKELSSFNRFRSDNSSESHIEEALLIKLRKDLLDLKKRYNNYILPNEEFIKNLGNRGFGCIKLIKQMKFPQLKIGTNGEMLFCCDLHDPITCKYSIFDFPEKLSDFKKDITNNPYIRLCSFFNPCDFSVNSVKYKTK